MSQTKVLYTSCIHCCIFEYRNQPIDINNMEERELLEITQGNTKLVIVENTMFIGRKDFNGNGDTVIDFNENGSLCVGGVPLTKVQLMVFKQYINQEI